VAGLVDGLMFVAYELDDVGRRGDCNLVGSAPFEDEPKFLKKL